MVDINEIQSDTSPFIATLERCQLLANNSWASYQFKPVCQSQFENAVSKAVASIAEDNPYLTVKEGEINALDALKHIPGSYGLDIRPKFYDKKTQSWTLLDSGSCVSITPKGPKDVINPEFRLRAVNGNAIPTFGKEVISVRIGRKTYDVDAYKVDIPQRILGWDFFKKHSLGFEWGQFGDLFITDKKANISSRLKCFKIPAVSVESIQKEDYYEEPNVQRASNESILFESACIKALDKFVENEISALTILPNQPSPLCDDLPLTTSADPDANLCLEENLKALSKLQGPYKELIGKYPEILKITFKNKPAEGIYHRIETEGAPFKSKVRPLLADSEKSEMGKKIWQEMEDMGVIERVKPNTLLQYTSPLHLVKKPHGRGYRICADFRKLNQITKSDYYPLPLLRNFQSKIKGAKIFSKLDIKSAFHHLPIHPKDVNKTCVLSPWGGAFVFKRLAFGLTNGPSSWQKYVDSVIGDIPGLFCYLDDLLVCSENVESHLSTLETLCQKLSAHGLTLALDKCEFGKTTVDYLGYQVSTNGICPQKRKVEAIERIPEPQTQKALLQFLGALNYFRASLSGLVKNGVYHNAANLLQPLYSAATVKIPTHEKFRQVWNESPVLQQAFKDAKELLIKAAELSHPDPSLPLALMCDASDHSIGSVLLQQSKTGKWTPLGYMSRHLPVDKCRWSTCRKELLAAQSGLRYFINEIYGRHCTIYSDHAPLVLAFKNPQGFQLHDPVAQRALMEIGQFTKDVRHIEGLKNTGSDYLSRIPLEIKGSLYQKDADNSVNSIEGHKLTCLSPSVVEEAQQTCKEIELVKAGKHPTSVIFQSIKMGESNVFCEMSLAQPRPFLPKPLRAFVMKQMHFSHDGIKESVRKMSSHYYWPEMRAEITRFVQSCHGCQSTTADRSKKPHYGHFEVPDQRFSHCHVDIVGPLPESEGFKYILTIIDRTTRQLSALPLKEPSAKSCSQAFLLHYVALYGIPSACTSDQGSNFVSQLFQEMQNNLGIEIKHTPIYWPQGNGLVERSHQTLKNKIKAQLEEMGQKYKNDWYHVLPWALLGQRTAFNKDLGTSSSELTLGTHIQVPGCILKQISHDAEEPSINDILEKLQIKNSRAAIPTSKLEQEEIEAPQNVTHVYVRQHDTKGLETRYRGPFKVINRPSRSTIEVKVGLTSSGEVRSELRSWKDCKPAYLREGAVEAQRPKRGRPIKTPAAEESEESKQIVTPVPEVSPNLDPGNSNRYNLRPRKSTVAEVWSASKSEIAAINAAISRNRGT